MKQKQTLYLIIISGVIIATLLLFINCFFCDFNTSTFNEVITPIATISAAAIYFATLLEIRKGNSFGQYNLFKSNIDSLKLKLEKKNPIKYEVTSEMDIEVKEKIEKFDIINFYDLYFELYCKVLDTKEYKENQYAKCQDFFQERVFHKYLDLIFKITFHVNSEFKKVQTMLYDIKNSNLDIIQKQALYDMLESDILKNYIFMFNSFNFKPKPVEFDGKEYYFHENEIAFVNPRNEKELTSFHRFDKFDELYNKWKNK